MYVCASGCEYHTVCFLYAVFVVFELTQIEGKSLLRWHSWRFGNAHNCHWNPQRPNCLQALESGGLYTEVTSEDSHMAVIFFFFFLFFLIIIIMKQNLSMLPTLAHCACAAAYQPTNHCSKPFMGTPSNFCSFFYDCCRKVGVGGGVSVTCRIVMLVNYVVCTLALDVWFEKKGFS